MSQFEFVQVAVAIVLGLGLTDILRNLGEQVRRRHEVTISSLQVMASCLLLMVTLVYLWLFWRMAAVDWTLPLFMLLVGQAAALAFAAQTIRVDLDAAESPHDQYLRNAPATYLAWALAPGLATVFSLLTDFQAFDVGRIGIAVLLLSLAAIRNPLYHRVVVTTLLVVVLSTPAFVQFALD